MRNFTYHTRDNALLRAQRLADLLHCADHLAISGAEDSKRFIPVLINIASDYAQALVNELDAGEVSTVKPEHGVCNG
ncbi:hypothetical protein [Cedecea sp. NFIX57]|uniref:hypothetical protein n=1 Tax=Cedecea sp. NFIX57 TaxID=1566286 RepID=UPI000A0AFD7F|nr:hypothetical protein [Cedecea sp. NFIX57]SMG37485.1 hypothetical protein SAMN03159353_1008188 [Cedecea sp. NFIX57]